MSALTVNIEQKIFADHSCTIADLNFSVTQGEFVAIVGPSGTGKTTLLNIIAGIESQFEGEILFEDTRQQPKRRSNSGANSRPNISFMFQDARLLPWLTVRQNIELVLGETSQSKRTRALNLLQQVGLSDVIDQYPGQLSGGMKRRVSMVRAFVNQPPFLLMDEPFQSLDEPTAEGLRDMLLALWSQTQPTILFVTHSLREALAMADRILFLSDKPAKVILDYTIKASRPRQLEDETVTTLYTQLLTQHPKLLSGLR